jgi:hypothetical protein
MPIRWQLFAGEDTSPASLLARPLREEAMYCYGRNIGLSQARVAVRVAVYGAGRHPGIHFIIYVLPAK